MNLLVKAFNRKTADDHQDLQLEGVRRVYRFVADDVLWNEIERRVLDGQILGQAFMNAGDHADRPYSWELDFDTVAAAHTWGYLAQLIDQHYGTEANPIRSEGYVD